MADQSAQQVRRSSRIQRKQEAAAKTASKVSGLKHPAKSATKRPSKPTSSKVKNHHHASLKNDDAPVVPIDAHHLSFAQYNPSKYIPQMSGDVEAAFDTILRFKDANRNRAMAIGLCQPRDLALDGMYTSIMREVISVLRPETSPMHKNMDYLSFLTHESATPFLWALNKWDEATTAPLMRKILKNDKTEGVDESSLEDMMCSGHVPHHPVTSIPVTTACIACALQSTKASQEMVDYVTQLAASTQRIYQASDVSDTEKLLWISAIRLFLIATEAALVASPGMHWRVGGLLSKYTLNTTMSLALGEHTRTEDGLIDHKLLNEAVEGTTGRVDPMGRSSWVKVLNDNAFSIFNELVCMPTFELGFGGIQHEV